MARQKGSKNIKVGRFIAEVVATKKNYDPLETLIDIAKGDWKALGLTEEIPLCERNKAAKEVAKYLYSAKQSVELSSGEQGFKIVIEDYSKK